MGSRYTTPFFDSGDGIKPADGSELFFFSSGTNNPKDTFSDESLITANANPVIADSDGRFSDIWIGDGARFKVQLKNKNGVQIWESDPVVGGVSGSLIAKTFDNATAMIASAELNIGDIVITTGYNTKGDGGGNQYEVVAAGTGVADGGTFIDLTTHQVKALFPGGIKNIEQFGAVGDGVTDDVSKFVSAAATGDLIYLQDGKSYLISAGMNLTGGGFCCDGEATFILKTGAVAFDSVDHTASKNALNRAVMVATGLDGIKIKGIRFKADGANDVVIYPVRINGGMTTKPADIERLVFEDIPSCNAGFLAINSVGEAAYRVRDLTGLNCGNAQGNSFWTGVPQLTVFEVDNDLISSVHSEPGYFENIRAENVLLTGAALADFNQQTDCVNIAGVSSGTDRKGPTGNGVYADGVGELLDLFCSNAVIKGCRGRNIQNDVVKLIHGAQYNDIEIENIESYGRSVVHFAGGSSATTDVLSNNVKIGSVRGGGEVGSFTDTSVVLFSSGTQEAKNNTIRVDNVLGNGTDLDYIVRDGGADAGNNNYIQIKKASGFFNQFCDAPPGNAQVEYEGQSFIKITMSATQGALVSTVPTVVEYDTVSRDIFSESIGASFLVRSKFPGSKRVRAQVRLSGLNDGDDIKLDIQQNGVSKSISEFESSGGGGEKSYAAETMLYIDENIAGKSTADLLTKITVTTAASVTISAAITASFFEITDIS